MKPTMSQRRVGLMRRGRVLARALVPRASAAEVAVVLGVSVSLVRKMEALALGKLDAALFSEKIQDRIYL